MPIIFGAVCHDIDGDYARWAGIVFSIEEQQLGAGSAS
jgi:hypothetical protein